MDSRVLISQAKRCSNSSITLVSIVPVSFYKDQVGHEGSAWLVNRS